jgi:hypothetical protein
LSSAPGANSRDQFGLGSKEYEFVDAEPVELDGRAHAAEARADDHRVHAAPPFQIR